MICWLITLGGIISLMLDWKYISNRADIGTAIFMWFCAGILEFYFEYWYLSVKGVF